MIALSDDQLGLLLFIGLFLFVAFCGWLYELGRKHEREDSAYARKERERFLEEAGYDPTPHHLPKKK